MKIIKRGLTSVRERLAHELFRLASAITPAQCHGIIGKWSWTQESESWNGIVPVKIHDASVSRPDMTDDRWTGRIICIANGNAMASLDLSNETMAYYMTLGMTTWLELPAPVSDIEIDRK